MTTYQYRPQFQTTILDDPAQYLRAREAEAMCDHVWIFEARTLSTQPVRRRCGMCGVYRMEPRGREPGIQTHGGPDQEKPSGLLVGRINPLWIAHFFVPGVAPNKNPNWFRLGK